MPRLNVARAVTHMKRLLGGPTPLAVAPSPDGRWLASSSAAIDWDANTQRESLRLRPVGGGRGRTLSGLVNIRDLRWTPDGRRLCFLARARRGGPLCLFRWTPRAARPMRLALKGKEVAAYAFGPRGETYYVAAPTPESAPAATVHYPREAPEGELRRLGGGRIGAIAANAAGLRVSADGRRLAWLGRPSPHEEGLFATEVRVTDLRTGKATPVGTPRWGVSACAFSPTHPDRLAVVARRIPGVYPSIADLFLLEGGRCRNLSRRHDVMTDGPLDWNADGTRLRLFVYRGVNRDLVEFDLAGRMKTLAEGFIASAGYTGSAPSHAIAATPETPPRLLDLAHPEPASDYGCRPQRVFRWEYDGRALCGVLALPRGKPPHPLVLYVHGGPLSPVNNAATRIEHIQPLAAAGLAVFVPAFRGTMGFGQEFIRANVGDLAFGPWRDMESGVDALIRAGLADARRLAVMGVSYGGYMALFIPTQSRRFRAAVAINSIYDLAADAGTTHRGPFAAVYLRAFPWEAPAEYLRQCAAGHVRRLATPTLLLHGEADTNTPFGNARLAAYALRNLRREFRFKSYAGEGHAISRPQNRLDVIREAVEWLDAHLRPDCR